MIQKLIASILLTMTVSAAAMAQSASVTPAAPAAGMAMPMSSANPGMVGGATLTSAEAPLTTAADQVVRLPLNKTLQLQLPNAVRDVIVGNQDIADVIVRSPTQLFLLGRKVGDTNVFLLDSSGKVILQFEINVHPDTDSIKALLTQLLPSENIRDRKSTRLNSSHIQKSRMPSSA